MFYRGRRKVAVLVALAMVAVFAVSGVYAADGEGESEGPPLPLHTFEGVGGRPITPTAYLTNPGPEGTTIGKPSVSAQYLMIGNRDMPTLAATWTLWERLELGYAVNRFSLDGLNDALSDFSGGMARTTEDELYLHHFNARFNLIPENVCGYGLVPAVTAGAHYKYNNGIDDLNDDVGNLLETIDFKRDRGFDATLTASKTIKALPRPVILSAGLRQSKASQFGLQGFTDEYMWSFEGNIGVLVTDRLLVGAEVRQQQEALDGAPGLVEQADTWWDVHAGYILNNNTDIYAVVGDAGSVLEKKDEVFYGAVLKYEF